MDFSRLPRRSLQYLCKMNKIPANTTNITMAEALNSLHTVDGLDVIIQQTQQSPVSTSTLRSHNPVRSCRKQNLLNNISKEEDAIESTLPLNALMPCSEKALCLKSVVECTESIRGNLLEFGGRSVAVQADSDEIKKCFVEILEVNDGPKCLEFKGCDDIFIEADGEINACAVVDKSEVRDKECVDSLLSMQYGQVSGYRYELSSDNTDDRLIEILTNDDYVSEVVKDDNEIVRMCGMKVVAKKDQLANACVDPNGEIHVKEFIESSSMQNVQVTYPLAEPSMNSTDQIMRTVSNDSENLTLSEEKVITKKGQLSNSCIDPDSAIRVRESIDTSSLQNVQAATPLTVPSPKSANIVSHEIDVSNGGIELNHGLEDGKDQIREPGCILSENREDTDKGKVYEETHNEIALLSDMKANGCLYIIKKDQEASLLILPKSEIHESHEINASIVDSALKHDKVLEKGNDDRKESVSNDNRKRNGNDMGKENEKVEGGEGMLVEVKTERQSKKKKRHLDELSLRKLRLMYKVNKEKIKLEIEGEDEREENVHCEEERQIKKAILDGLSLRKLKLMFKNKARQN